MAWTVSIIANYLKKGAYIMIQICAMCEGALARGLVRLCPCIVTSHDIVM
jgi:hypothetical protein